MCVRRSVRLLLNSDSSSYQWINAYCWQSIQSPYGSINFNSFDLVFIVFFFHLSLFVGNIFDCLWKNFIFPLISPSLFTRIGDMNANTTYRSRTHSSNVQESCVNYFVFLRCVCFALFNVGHENFVLKNSLHVYKLVIWKSTISI